MAQLPGSVIATSILGGIIGNSRKNFNVGDCSNAALFLLLNRGVSIPEWSSAFFPGRCHRRILWPSDLKSGYGIRDKSLQSVTE
jgi:hypothetical protein